MEELRQRWSRVVVAMISSVGFFFLFFIFIFIFCGVLDFSELSCFLLVLMARLAKIMDDRLWAQSDYASNNCVCWINLTNLKPDYGISIIHPRMDYGRFRKLA